MTDRGHYEKTQKACGFDILWTVDLITLKFDVVYSSAGISDEIIKLLVKNH